MQPAVCDYKPVHFIRCHFGDKNAIRERHTDSDPTDNVTNVWCCAMEPDPHDPGLLIKFWDITYLFISVLIKYLVGFVYFCFFSISLLCLIPFCLQCFDVVGWAAERASGL